MTLALLLSGTTDTHRTIASVAQLNAAVALFNAMPFTGTAVTIVLPRMDEAVSLIGPLVLGTPAVIGNDLYRILPGETVATRLAVNLPPNGTFMDFDVPMGVDAVYFVIAKAASGATAQSTRADYDLLNAGGVWLHAIGNPAGTLLNLAWDEGRSEQSSRNAAFIQYAGRARPVAEFDGSGNRVITANLTLKSTASDYANLLALLARQDTVCYRDARGRRVFGTLQSVDATDEFSTYAVTIHITETDYTEGV